MKSSPVTLLCILCLLFSGCANYRLNYGPEAEKWETEQPNPELKKTYSLYLLGDSGAGTDGKYPAGLELLGRHIKGSKKESGIIFLGNQIENHAKKTSDSYFEEQLKEQLEVVKDFPGQLFFLPGESDWNKEGLEGVEWQKKLIEKYLDREDVWLPDPGCSGPEEVELTDDLVLLLVDSEWYLRDWEGEIDINSDCEVKSRQVFEWLVNEELKSNRHKNTVVAMHHPLFSYGPHGGSHHLKEHLFPLTAVNENLYIPLPVIGSLATFFRASTGNRRDLVHPVYQDMVKAFLNPARQNGRYIFAGAHDRSLQYIERDSQVFIVSGAGSSDRTPVHTGKGAEFAYSRPGFARIDFYEDGSAWVNYWVSTPADEEGKLVFRKQIKEAFPEKVDAPEPDFEPIRPGQTVKIPVSERDYARGGMWRFLFGEHYRDVYKAEIEVPLFDLTRFNGGVKPVQRGGGAQTNSLRIEDGRGRQYTLRSVDKDATRTVPYPFNQDVVLDIVEDNFSASHPFGALAAASLSEYIGIYHNNPKLVYLPRQAALEEYNDDYAEGLYLLEERPDDDVWQDAEYFGRPEKIESTDNMLEELRENHDHVLDDDALVYARLFDMLLGDWDRHDDQWRWGRTDQDSVKVYHPIPRDRDQVFSNYDGFAGLFVRQSAANAKQFKPFRSRIRNTKWENYNARFLDQSLLTGLSWPAWEVAVKRLQTELTDERIEKALKTAWPEHIYQLDGPAIVQKLKLRRDHLLPAARERYLFLAKKVDVLGTDKKDLFEVEQLGKDSLRVRVYDTNSDRERELLFYERTFLKGETDEINLYGLEDDDLFLLKGNGHGGPRLHLIGGLGEDVYEDHNIRLKVQVFDTQAEKTEFLGDQDLSLHLSDDPSQNLYDRRAPAYEYNFGGYFPSVGFNPDDGVFVGVLGKYTTYGFKKAPFASQHQLGLGYALRTAGVLVDYKGVFTDVTGLWDLRLKLDAQTPLYSSNFYGLGNNTLDLEPREDQDRDFHRIRLSQVRLYPALLRNYNSGATFSIGPTLEFFALDRTPGRYIDQIADGLPEDIFSGRWYGGLMGLYEYRNQDDQVHPSRGLAVELRGGWKHQLGQAGQHFPFFSSAFTFYQKLEPGGRVVFATRLGLDHRFNDRFEFFQGATIGGSGPDANFRGWRRDRFTGRTAFYQNMDLRIKILDSSQWGLPMSFGVLGGFDHGRVWNSNDENTGGNIWHSSYGAGVWFSPLNMFVINCSIFRNDMDEDIITVQGSFFF